MVNLLYSEFQKSRNLKALKFLEDEKADALSENIDPKNPFQPPYKGFFRIRLYVEHQKRQVVVFIPDSFQPMGEEIVLLPADNQSADSILENSSWVEMAWKEGFLLMVLEAEGGRWKTDEADEEFPYFQAIGAFEYAQKLYTYHAGRRYYVGYGEGGQAVQLHLAMNPTKAAGMTVVGCNDMPDGVLEVLGAEESEEPGVLKQNIPVPAWIIGKNSENVNSVNYWRKCGRCTEFTGCRGDVTCYAPGLKWHGSGNNTLPVQQVWSSVVDSMSPVMEMDFINKLWGFLKTVERTGGNHLNGDLQEVVTWKEIGCIRHTAIVDDKLREWLVYLPSACQKSPEKKFPMVMGLHGYSGTGESFMCGCNFYKAAEEREFIAVCPSGFRGAETLFREGRATQPQWNSHIEWKERDSDDVGFLEYVMDRITESYPVDVGRCYCTGVSNGAMMVNKVMFYLTDRFAAYAAASGNMNDTHLPVENQLSRRLELVPHFRNGVRAAAWIDKGEFDYLQKGMSTDLDEAGSNYQLLARIAEENGMRYPEGMHYRENARWQHYTWTDNNGVPLLRYTLNAGGPHSFPAELAYLFWDDFFCHFRRDEKGELEYLL